MATGQCGADHRDHDLARDDREAVARTREIPCIYWDIDARCTGTDIIDAGPRARQTLVAVLAPANVAIAGGRLQPPAWPRRLLKEQLQPVGVVSAVDATHQAMTAVAQMIEIHRRRRDYGRHVVDIIIRPDGGRI